MNRSAYIMVFLLFAGLISSCKKTPVLENSGDAQWVKVVSDSAVFFTGKIRADAQSNLYCSYTYENVDINARSAIVKLDANGNFIWRKQFDSLTIYDFIVTQQGELIIASAKENPHLPDSRFRKTIVTLTKMSSAGNDPEVIGSESLPSVGIPILRVVGMKILPATNGNYILSGTMNLYSPKNDHAGFMLEMSADGAGLWKQGYLFYPYSTAATSITGCLQKPDGFILFGNVQYSDPIVSEFFVLKCNETGDSIFWQKFYSTSWMDSIYHGYYCSTSDLVEGDDGNLYGSAFNVLYNTPAQFPTPVYTTDDNSARVFRFSAEGDTLSSCRVKLDVQNQVADLIWKKDGGGLFIGLNPYKLGNFDFVGERHSFIANVSPDPDLQSVSFIQTQYTDYLGSVCYMPDGHYAIETMIQSLGQNNYKLQVTKTDENGNF